MWPLSIALLASAITAFYIGVTVPLELQRQEALTASVGAMNFTAYRSSVINYIASHSSVSGAIDDGNLIFPLGYTKDSRWASVVDSGTLYVFTTGNVDPQMMDMIFQSSRRSLLVGIKSPDGTLTSLNGSSVSGQLPTIIPHGSFVIVGR